ncbi:peptidylprolyl isomerase [bacterium]|nr:peptidylprolyl isomerase [bacterium]
MKYGWTLLLFGLITLFVLAGCPRDGGSTDLATNNAANAASANKGNTATDMTKGDVAVDETPNPAGTVVGETADEQAEAAAEGEAAAGDETTGEDTETGEADMVAEDGAGETNKEQDEAVTEDTKAGSVTTVVFETTKGNMVIEVHEEWSPIGAPHFLELVRDGYYDNTPFFRVIPGFVAQFGLSADPELSRKWGEEKIKDEPVVQGNLPTYLSYAKPGLPNNRTTQIFINYGDNSRLDADGFSCFGKVVEGFEDVAMKLYGCEWADQRGLATPEGLERFKRAYPDADFIIKAYIKE